MMECTILKPERFFSTLASLCPTAKSWPQTQNYVKCDGRCCFRCKCIVLHAPGFEMTWRASAVLIRRILLTQYEPMVIATGRYDITKGVDRSLWVKRKSRFTLQP